jgi:hypothetical protein
MRLSRMQKQWVILGGGAGAALVVMTIVTLAMGGGASGGASSTRELAEGVIAAAESGSVDQALALSPIDAFDGVMSCKDSREGDKQKSQLRDMITDGGKRRMDRWKGITATVVSVEPKGDPDVMRAKHEPEGNDCYNTVDITTQQLTIKVRASKDGGLAEDASIELFAMQIRGNWYAMNLPDPPAIGVRGKLAAVKQAMCSCKDQACVDSVHARFGSTSDLMNGLEPPDDDTMNVFREIMECETTATIGP